MYCERCGRYIKRSGRCLPCNYLYKHKKVYRGLKKADKYDLKNGMDIHLVNKLVYNTSTRPKKRFKKIRKIKFTTFCSIIKGLLKKNNTGTRKLKVRKQLKNQFFRDKVRERFNYKCHNCGTDGKKPYITKRGKIRRNPLAIHHKKYHWKCSPENSAKTNCENCFKNEKGNFEECLQTCVLLCDMCHYKKHKELKRTTGSWIG